MSEVRSVARVLRPDVLLIGLRRDDPGGPGLYRMAARFCPDLSGRVAFLAEEAELDPAVRDLVARTGAPLVASPYLTGAVRAVVRRLAGLAG
jgi:hypothetical protein